MKVVSVIDQEDEIYKILKHLGLLAAPEESRAPPATAPSPALSIPSERSESKDPPPQVAHHDLFSSTALNPAVPFSEIPAWSIPDPPGPDHASQPDSDPGDRFDDHDAGADPEAEDIA